MEKAFEIFLSWQFIICALLIWVMVFVIRQISETIWPWMPDNLYWRKLFLPLGPLVTGLLFGFVKSFPWPVALGADPSISARMAFGVIAGLFSGFAHAQVAAFIKAKGGEDVTTPPTPPTAPKV